MITIESDSARILETSENYVEVVDKGVLYKGTVFEITCEHIIEYGYACGRTQKIVMYEYTAEKLENGYIEKKIIKKALNKICEDNDGLYMDMDENVDVIYSELEKEGLIG